MKAVAPMAGITNADFLKKVIPYGFDMVTLGGYNIDDATLKAALEITKRGRPEFIIPISDVLSEISSEVNVLKEFKEDILISTNLRSTTPEAIVEVSKIPNLDIVEINCHCRQNELLAIGCGQKMLLCDDLEDFICHVVKKASSKVSVKIRANVSGVDTLEISKLISSCGVDYLHIDAMKVGFNDFDFELLENIVKEVDTFIIGNNSINSSQQLFKMLNTGVQGFSIGRALINGSIDFEI